MQSEGVRAPYKRPVGALESLGDALSAAFDENMELWREVAQSYCAPLRTDQERCLKRGDVCGEYGDWTHTEATSDVSMSQSGAASIDVWATSEDGKRGDSLAEKWAEVEALLSTIRPGRDQQEHTRISDRVVPLRVPGNVKMREPLARRRLSRCGNDIEDRDHTLHVCQGMLRAWAALALARGKSRNLKLIAEQHWHRLKCRRSFSQWRQFYQRRQSLQESSHAVLRLAQMRQLSTSLRHWRAVRRWSRGEKILRAWRDGRRKLYSFSCWLEIVRMSREMKRMRRNALSKCTEDALDAWKQFVVNQKAKREVCQLEKSFRLGRYFRCIVMGISRSRRNRRSLAVAVEFRRGRVYRRVLRKWIDYNTRQHRKNMAVKWWTLSVLSRSFEAWNLLHRCFAFRNLQTLRAQTCFSTGLLRRSVTAWRKLVQQQQQQRAGLVRLLTRAMQRACFRRLRSAVQAESVLSHQLQQWKIRRHVHLWRLQARRRALISKHRHEVEALRRVRTLHEFAWRRWRGAYECRLRVKRLIAVADQNALRAWWRRWRDYGTAEKARRAIWQIVDIERSRREQRRAVWSWRRFCSSQIASKTGHNISIRHNTTSLLKTGLQRWRTWLCGRKQSQAQAADAERLFLRHCLVRWQSRALLQKNQAFERADTIVQRHPLWLKRVWFVTWQRKSRHQGRGRVSRLFRLWQQFLEQARLDRQVDSQARKNRLTKSWRRWAALRTMAVGIRERSSLLENSVRKRLLHKALVEVWQTRKTRVSTARQILEKISVVKTTKHALRRWKKHVHDRNRFSRAIQWHYRRMKLKVLRSLHAFLILWPLHLARNHENKRKQRLFDAWAAEAGARRRLRRATIQLNEWRVRRAVKKMLVRWETRQHHDQRTNSAVSLYRQRRRRLVFDAWLHFTASRLTCREATEQIISSVRQRIFKSWQRAFARQLFVHELEAHFDHALLQQVWTRFRDAIRQKQNARHEWVTQLSSVLLRKTMQRWRQLVENQKIQLLVASSRASMARNRLLAQVVDEWTHFISIRAFVTDRRRREALCSEATSVRHWKLYVLLRYRARRREQWVMLSAFSALKSHAIASEAGREVHYRRLEKILASAWKAWRVEFWIHQSQATNRNGLVRRCFDAWRLRTAPCYDSRRDERSQHPAQLNSPHQASRRLQTAFTEAAILQHTVRHQRTMMQRVVHAWALAAQTCKRQRLKGGSDMRPYARRLGDDHDCPLESEDQENADPNMGRRVSAAKLAMKEDVELAALESWSSQLLKGVFDEWRRCVRSNELEDE